MHKMYKKCWLKLTGSKFAVDTDRPGDSVLHENLLFPLGPEFMTQNSRQNGHRASPKDLIKKSISCFEITFLLTFQQSIV